MPPKDSFRLNHLGHAKQARPKPGHPYQKRPVTAAQSKTRRRRTGVAMLEYRYEPPFKFTGKIDKLTFRLEPESRMPPASKAELEPMAAPEPDPIDAPKQ